MIKEQPNKSIPSPIRIIRENDNWYKCGFCGSSLYCKWGIFRTPYCIQPKCKNYYKKQIKKW